MVLDKAGQYLVSCNPTNDGQLGHSQLIPGMANGPVSSITLRWGEKVGKNVAKILKCHIFASILARK